MSRNNTNVSLWSEEIASLTQLDAILCLNPLLRRCEQFLYNRYQVKRRGAEMYIPCLVITFWIVSIYDDWHYMLNLRTRNRLNNTTKDGSHQP